MTALRPVSDDVRTPPKRLAAVLVPLYCGLLAAVGAAAGPVMVVGTLFAPAIMLPVSLLLLVATGFANAAILRSATGRRRIGLATLLTLVVPVGTGAVLVAQGEIPFDPYYGIPVPIVIGAVAAGISTFALPSWAKLVGVVTIAVVVAPYGSQAARAAAAAGTSPAANLEENYGLVLPGATTTLVSAETDLRTFTAYIAEVGIDLDGRELTITMSAGGDSGEQDPDGVACWNLSEGWGGSAGPGYVDYANLCPVVNGGWATPDGLAFGTYRHGHGVTVTAGPAATAEDVAAVAKTLADVPAAEHRAHWETENPLPPEPERG